MLSNPSARAVVSRRLLAIGAMATLWLAVSGLLSPVAAATHAVEIGDGFFGPSSLTVTVGDTVTWTNGDDSPHTVTADGAFDSGNIEPGQSFSHTFSEPGTFTYVCQYHDEMVATITVVDGAPAAPPAAPPAPGSEAPAPAGGTGATSGATDGTATHASGEHDTGQPDTALPVGPGTVLPGWAAPLLIGLGLLAFGIGVVPEMVGSDPEPQPGRGSSGTGWRR